MLAFTDQPTAPWDVISAEQKRYGRLAVLRTVISRMEEGMRRWGIEPPLSTGADYTAETSTNGGDRVKTPLAARPHAPGPS